jgi:ketosteroid isomerase-like protein
MKKAALFIAVLLTGMSHLSAQELENLSKKYIDAYFSMDQKAYGPMLAENVTWSDPTWSEVDPANKPVTGKAAVLAHLKMATAGITNMSYTIEEHFVSGPVAVFEGVMKYTWTDGNSGKAYDFSIREVSVLEFQNGKVVRHTDYSDFKSWLRQYSSQ